MANVALGSAIVFAGTLLGVSQYTPPGITTPSEPASLVIFGIGLLALAVLARRAARRD